ncbi:MAG: type IV secretion system protein [Alphaproteobacteria bacterium]|jgi:type IV secretory pathway component VirB8|nr:type IV secretion system protein [Alphaproteobacteria bacterium]OJV12554.1 MAG: hypothetical protein BGO27_03420 [Alphaproteobacteria bacterium 33-17]
MQDNMDFVALEPFLEQRRLNKTYKFSAYALGGLCALLVIGVLCISLYTITKPPEVVYVELNSDKQTFVKILPKAHDMIPTENDQLVRSFLRGYVQSRHEVNFIDDQKNVQLFLALSDEKIIEIAKKEFNEFREENKGVTRSIDILDDFAITDSLSQNNNIHQVNFKTIDRKDGKEAIRYWTAKIRYSFTNERKYAVTESYLNPMKILVSEYSISRKKEGSHE